MSDEKPLQSFANIDLFADFALVKVNSKIFPLSIVVSAAYDLMDKGYFVIDGDPEKEMIVEVRLQDSNSQTSLLELAKEFNNQLINYAFYEIQSARTKGVREVITRAALFGQPEDVEMAESFDTDNRSSCEVCDTTENGDNCESSTINDGIDVDEIVDSFDFDDPEGIAIPWDEKYGKSSGE
ncbi:MAG: hypothetical protein PWP03_760 [Candidatus Woesearchaeota archaeon]|nr:hypothetical protein [Candidatus Woesearchaeota archaeon]MDN5328122.1 hypothetical protein [Candidatus Woesearchaeota archaeon]